MAHGELVVRRAAMLANQLKRWFGVALTVVDGDCGEVLFGTPDQPHRDWGVTGQLCRTVAQRGTVEIVEEEGPLAVLAFPLGRHADTELVAAGVFLVGPFAEEAALAQAARLLGMHPHAARAWLEKQRPIGLSTLIRLADAVAAHLKSQAQANQLQVEVEKLSLQIGATFEEISLIYRLTQNLKISSNPEELGQIALNWLSDVVPAQSLALQMLVESDDETLPAAQSTRTTLLTTGRCPVSDAEFTQLLAHLHLDKPVRPQVHNRGTTSAADWPFEKVQELILVPLAEGDHLFGWLAAFNHSQRQEFGTVEATLLSSVATILGIHSSNIDLYKQQADLLAGVVRVMSSAIDAKDPYTHGHSDRVARVAVRLAQELGCDKETLKTIYLAGLLHDIGKIGIDDNVLRKPGKLTDAEYEHIKTHVEIGYRILRDLRKLGQVLPVVLHHHESWDGGGYPYGMSGTNIPFLARIAAVADAYDAMISDRPYRKGMSDEKVDSILREGAGKQWDPEVVAAFFRARDDIRDISQRDGEKFDPTSLQWV